MKKILFFLFLLCFVVACNVPGSEVVQAESTGEPQNTTEAVLAPESTPLPAEIAAPIVDSPSIIAINMLDEVNGWGVTETQVIRTNDGGVTWYDVTPAGLAEVGYGVSTDFFDVSHAWVQFPDPDNFPNGGTIYRTSDGGITWSSNSTPFSDGHIAFVDANNGWIMADLGAGAGSNAVSVFQTTNGGTTWTRTFTNDPNLDGAGDTLPLSGIKYAITPINMQTAWISGVVYAPGSVYLFRTDDGGKTWSQVDLTLSPEGQLGDLSVEQVKFVSPTDGALSLRIGTDIMQTVIYTTNDGGDTWVLAPAKLPNAGELNIVSAQEMVFYNRDQFYVTEDAAQTWSIIPPDVAFGDNFASMSFANLTIGWVITADASDHHTLYKTTDGGATWSAIIP
jgi:photosystem II stability/assembly factor-like uncharacterized protein